MVTNGDRKTNSFGKLVRQKVGLFSSWFSADQSAIVALLLIYNVFEC